MKMINPCLNIRPSLSIKTNKSTTTTTTTTTSYTLNNKKITVCSLKCFYLHKSSSDLEVSAMKHKIAVNMYVHVNRNWPYFQALDELDINYIQRIISSIHQNMF